MPEPSIKVLVNPRGVSRIDANTFLSDGRITKMLSYDQTRLR